MNEVKVALLANVRRPDAVACSNEIIAELHKAGDTVFVHKDLRGLLPDAQLCDDHFELARSCDVFVAVGGDGTIMHAAKHASKNNLPTLGVNVGRIGYLSGLERDQTAVIHDLLSGKVGHEEQRKMLDISVNNNKHRFTALNDCVVSGELSTLHDFEVKVNRVHAFSYRSDGIIVATPTGSTAYSLSAGGPVTDPELNCMICTPICPHSLFGRSLIYGPDKKLTIYIPDDQRGRIILTVDGGDPLVLGERDSVEVTVSDTCARLLKYDNKGFYDIVNKKFLNKIN